MSDGQRIELDHLMWGTPDLAEGIREAESLFGVAPVEGGVHPGLGTRNALLSLGERTYLEVIAPDPAQELSGNLGGRLATLDAPGLITWAAAAPDLTQLAKQARALALTVRGPAPTERAAPDGSLLAWELLFLGGHRFGALVPFFIDWLATPHPASSNPIGGTFESLEVFSPEAEALNALFSGLNIAVRAESAAEPGLIAHIAAAAGPVRLSNAPEARAWSL